ncbi:MAG: CDP-alcohol phosphatidyltransferase family protein, partial [Nitrospira sp.]|nr:CDP-alcohol phosphatidyltransferase family protein [Nitrospira sp.]
MGEGLIQKDADVHGLSTAILLPSSDLFGAPVRTAVGPLTHVVGIGLFARTVLTLQRAGIRQLIVLTGSDEDQLKQSLGKGPRVTIPVRWMPVREFPLDDPKTWEALAAEVRGFCLVSGVGGVFSRQLIEQLRQDVREGQAIVVGRGAATGDLRSVKESDRLPLFDAAPFGSGEAKAADLVVLPTSMLSTAGQVPGMSGSVPIRQWLERAVADGHVRVLGADIDPAQWYQPVRDTEDIRIAERKLFSTLKGEFEGFVDRFFNRKLSRRFTRVFLALGLSPNAITIVSTTVGLMAAIGFGLGTYAAGIAAAVLFQLAAVIDCCDGEVARLTFTESPFGAWLDIAMDNVVHMAIFGGIAIG